MVFSWSTLFAYDWLQLHVIQYNNDYVDFSKIAAESIGFSSIIILR